MPYLLGPRNPLDEAKDTLSSWDKCMAKNYCKWPVIVAIVVGSLIILSVVLCVARCICCGAECACCCFRCCAGCCGSGRGKKHKRMKSDPNAGYPPAYPPAHPPPAASAHPPNEQYQSHAAPTISPVAKYRAPEPERPQFATFESPSKPANEDSLPAMPEWGSAKSTRVEEEVIPEKHGDVELDRFDHNGSVAGASLAGTTALAASARSTGRSPIQRSPTADSYGFPQGYQNQAIANSPRRSPRNSPGIQGAQFGQQQDQYRGASPAQSLSPVYGAGAGYAQNQQYGRNSPAQNRGQNYDQQYNRAPQGRTPPPLDDYGYGPAELSSDYGGSTLHDNNNYGPARSHTPGYAPPVRSNTGGFAPSEMDASNYAPVRSNTGGYPPNELDASNYPLKELAAPSYAPVRSNSPGYAVEQPNVAAYAPSSTYTESNYAPEQPSAYPGQQTYAPEPAYPGQQSYQAFQPSAPQGQQESAPARRPINGSWKEV